MPCDVRVFDGKNVIEKATVLVCDGTQITAIPFIAVLKPGRFSFQLDNIELQ